MRFWGSFCTSFFHHRLGFGIETCTRTGSLSGKCDPGCAWISWTLHQEAASPEERSTLNKVPPSSGSRKTLVSHLFHLALSFSLCWFLLSQFYKVHNFPQPAQLLASAVSFTVQWQKTAVSRAFPTRVAREWLYVALLISLHLHKLDQHWLCLCAKELIFNVPSATKNGHNTQYNE